MLIYDEGQKSPPQKINCRGVAKSKMLWRRFTMSEQKKWREKIDKEQMTPMSPLVCSMLLLHF